jgi:predicted permease
LGLTVVVSNYSFLYEFRRPPAVPDGDRYVGIQMRNVNSNLSTDAAFFNGYMYNRICHAVKGFEIVGAFDESVRSIYNDGVVSRVMVSSVTPELMASAQIQPSLGRMFTDEDVASFQRLALISHSYWQNIFANDPDIIGLTIAIDGVNHTIIGVMPKQFEFPYFQDIWRPLNIDSITDKEDSQRLTIVGKKKRDVSDASLAAQLNTVIAELNAEIPHHFVDLYAVVKPINALKQDLVGIKELLTALTIVVFLLASLNLSTLLFARANERSQELAVRNAIGANAWQLRKQVLLESGLLCGAGCILAMLFTVLFLHFVRVTIEGLAPYSGAGVDIGLDFRLRSTGVTYALLMTVGIWLCSSLFTAYKITKGNLHLALEGGSKGATSRASARTTQVIVGLEVVFSCFLLILCGLISHTIIKQSAFDFAVATEQRFITEFRFQDETFSSLQEQQNFIDQLSGELLSDASVAEVMFTNSPPGSMSWPDGHPYTLDDRNLNGESGYPWIVVGLISNGYHNFLEVPLLEGRAFSPSDNQHSQPVVIVDEKFAQRYWPNDSAIGKRIQLDPESKGEWLEIVGVSRHVVHGMPLEYFQQRSAIYRPIQQNQFVGRVYLSLAMRQPSNITEVTEIVSDSVARINREVANGQVMHFDRFVASGNTPFQLLAQIMAWISFATLALSVIGVYGIISRSVLLRGKEIGIRRALGSTTAKINRIFIGQGCWYLTIGIVLGGGGALLASNVMASLFDNLLQGLLPVSLLVLGTLGSLIVVACLLPTRQVLSMEPGDALRDE